MTIILTQHAIERASQRAWDVYIHARESHPGGFDRAAGRGPGRSREPLGLVTWLKGFAQSCLRSGVTLPPGLDVPGMRQRGTGALTRRRSDRARVVLDGSWALLFEEQHKGQAVSVVLVTLVKLDDEVAAGLRRASGLVRRLPGEAGGSAHKTTTTSTTKAVRR